MRYILIPTLLILQMHMSYGQPGKVKVNCLVNGQIDSRDSIYVCDTIIMREQYYFNTPDEDELVQRKERAGKEILYKGVWFQIGLWKYWDMKGNLLLETFNPDLKSETRYVNQWNANGDQILKYGSGHYYCIEPQGNGISDSIIYEVCDSMKHGNFNVWRKTDEDESYFLYESGIYNKNKEESCRTRYFKNRSIHMVYENPTAHDSGFQVTYYKNGVINSFGYVNKYHSETGKWKYWNENGNLIKECQFKGGRLFGEYLEYYDNGNKKIKGCYVHIKGNGTMMTINELGQIKEETFETFNTSAKDGIWEYYDINGNLIRHELFDKGKQLTIQDL